MSQDLFVHPKVLDYQGDKYQLITLAMRWARITKSKGTPEPLQSLIEKALVDIVEKRVTPEEILAVPAPVEPPKEEAIDPLVVADTPRALPPDDDDEEEKKKSKKKKKDEAA